MRHRQLLLIGVAALLSFLSAVALHRYGSEPNLCSMSYNRGIYFPLDFSSPHSKVSSKYSLYLYREGGMSPRFESMDDVNNLGGTPVLFIPGNAGSYNQGRSFAAYAATRPQFDWFLADLDEDLSAFHGKTLLDEARYINDAIAYILELYSRKTDGSVHPKSVLIVAHSMGGIVARTLVTLDNYIENSVNTIITLSTPHVNPPITFDRDVTELYDLVARWWRHNKSEGNDDIALVSIAGGHSDLLVLPDMTVIDSLGGLSAFSYEIPGVGIGIDHLAIVWCAELRNAVIESIDSIVDVTSPSRTLPYEERMARLSSRLKRSNLQTEGRRINETSAILFGRTSDHYINDSTNIVLPSISSLISYRVTSDQPVHITHLTEKEIREYGEVKEATLMWYSAGPFIPFSTSTERLTVLIRPAADASGSTSTTAKVSISVDKAMTLANILLHFRTLSASWPYAIVVITVMFSICSCDKSSFGLDFLSRFLKTWFIRLVLILTGLHIALTYPEVRSVFRAIQFPSEASNVAELHRIGYDAHDLLLGTNDRELFWMVPLLFTIATCFVYLVQLAASFVVILNNRLASLVKRGIYRRRHHAAAVSPGSSVATSPGDSRSGSPVQEKPRKIRERSPYSLVITVLALIAILYIIPYQVSTIVLTVVQLLQLRDTQGIQFGMNQLLLWTCVVDAPILAVWIRNLTFEWLWAFASIKNVYSSLPLAMFVLFTRPDDESGVLIHNPTLRKISLVFMAYIAGYSFLYGGLHAFMLQHLTNYCMAWIVALNLLNF